MAATPNTSPATAQVARVRRIVTGHNDRGQAVVVSDDFCPHVVVPIPNVPTLAGTELWTATTIPADNTTRGDPTALPKGAAPPAGGAVFRIVEFPPDSTFRHMVSATQSLTDGHTMAPRANPLMHRTRSLDFVIVIEGEIWCVLDEGEVLMRAGDTMVQRGTNHDWQNRSTAPTRVAFAMFDAEPIPGLT